MLFLDLHNRDSQLGRLQPIEWHESSRGDLVLSERDFDSITGRINSREVTIHSDGRRSERSYSLRLYTYTELDRMLQTAGLQTQSTYGDFDSTPFDRHSRRMILIASKGT